MLFAVIFRDKPGYGDIRAQHLDAHIRWLEENKTSVLVGGSLRESPEKVPLGGLWVVEAQSKQAVHDLMASDPFFTCGLRQGIEVLHWNKAFPSRRVPV